MNRPGALWMRAKEIFLTVLAVVFMAAVPFGVNADIPSLTPGPGRAAPRPLLATGKVLVASTRMKDPRFAGTVILIVENGPLGTAGLIVNQPTATSVGTSLSNVKGFKGRPDVVFYGGPVRPDRAMALVLSSKNPPRSVKVFDDVYIGRGRGFFEGLPASIGPGNGFRVYAGYVRWNHHELDWEVAMGGWEVMDATPEIVFARDPKTLWHRLVR